MVLIDKDNQQCLTTGVIKTVNLTKLYPKWTHCLTESELLTNHKKPLDLQKGARDKSYLVQLPRVRDAGDPVPKLGARRVHAVYEFGGLELRQADLVDAAQCGWQQQCP